MSMQRQEKLSNVKTYEYEGAWEPDDTVGDEISPVAVAVRCTFGPR